MHTKHIEHKKFHIHICQQNYCNLHNHEYLELTFVAQGTIDHHINGQTVTVHEGEYFIVDHGTAHCYERISQDSLKIVNVLFFPEFVDRMLTGCHNFEELMNSYLLKFGYKTLNGPVTGVTFRDDDKKVAAMVNEMVQEYSEKNYGRYEYIRCLLVKILITTMRKVGKSSEAKQQSKLIKDVTDNIRHNYAKRLRLSDIAKEMGYSLGYLSKRFSDEMGVGFSEYLQRVRIEQSCKLIETTELTVSEIAHRVGYDDLKHFNKTYKEILGLTPREFKKMHR